MNGKLPVFNGASSVKDSSEIKRRRYICAKDKNSIWCFGVT